MQLHVPPSRLREFAKARRYGDLDHLKAAHRPELANISERRVEQLVNPALSSGLTPFLARDSGLHSGFMIAQVASASLVSENKVLCHPASVDSIPSSAGREDHEGLDARLGGIDPERLLPDDHPRGR